MISWLDLERTMFRSILPFLMNGKNNWKTFEYVQMNQIKVMNSGIRVNLIHVKMGDWLYFHVEIQKTIANVLNVVLDCRVHCSNRKTGIRSLKIMSDCCIMLSFKNPHCLRWGVVRFEKMQLNNYNILKKYDEWFMLVIFVCSSTFS